MSTLSVNGDALNRIHDLSVERFVVEFYDPTLTNQRIKTYTDSAVGIIAYLLPTDVVVSIKRVET